MEYLFPKRRNVGWVEARNPTLPMLLASSLVGFLHVNYERRTAQRCEARSNLELRTTLVRLMLKRILQWIKQLIQRLFGRPQPPDPPEQTPPPPKTDAELETTFLRLLEGVNNGWSRGNVLGFLIGQKTTQTELAAWLRPFGETLLPSPTQHEELARRMGLLGDLSCGELSDLAGEISDRLLAPIPPPPDDEKSGNDGRDEVREGESVGDGLSVSEEMGDDAAEEIMQEAEEWYDRGLQLYKAGDFLGAIASWDRALEIKPDLYEAWGCRGAALGNSERYSEALASFDRALEIKPDDHVTWYNRGATLENLERYSEALASWDRALEIKPDFHDAWYNRGVALGNLERYSEALASYDRALEIKPDFHEAWCNRGVALENLERYKEALASYDRALEIKPDLRYAWCGRGVALKNLERYEEALASYDRALEIKPDLHYAWFDRGVALENLERYSEALASHDRALEIKPDFYDVWFFRGLVLGNLERYSEALASYDRALEIKPDFHEAWSNRGAALGKLGRYEEAIASYDRALAIKPDFHQSWRGRGIAAEDSRSCSTRVALSLPPEMQNSALDQRGYEGRLASHEEGLKYCPQDTHPEGCGMLHQAIGQAHYSQGWYGKFYDYWRKAIASYNRALQTLTQDDFPELHLKVLQDLIKALLGVEQTDEAEEMLRRGTDLLQRLLEDLKRSDFRKKQLAFKFISFQQLTVDKAVRSSKLSEAWELAEAGKNACLTWLLGAWGDEIPQCPYADFQQLLPPTTAAIYWHLSPAALTTFIIFPNQEIKFLMISHRPLAKLENWVKDWNQQYRYYRESSKTAEETTPTWKDNLPAKLEQLKDILNIDDIVAQLQGSDIENLILIPHRDLHRFPLHALFPEPYTITYLPSAQIGISLAEKAPTQTETLLSIECPDSQGYKSLPFAEIESAAITQLFPATSIPREQATKAEVKKALEKPHRIFHFAGHGEYKFTKPSSSALMLTGEEKLAVKEILYMELSHYQLIGLAACETAVTGDETITTEYVGLVSAFLSRYVNYVLSTLWTVESEASALISIYFYRRLQKGDREPIALGKAQKWLRQVKVHQLRRYYRKIIAQLPEENSQHIFLEREELRLGKMASSHRPYAHPYYWAAFTLTGFNNMKIES